WRRFAERSRRLLEGAGVDPDAELDPQHRRLSPSDFGFHNALQDPEGRWSFVDFEYFGWDDPAKTLCDLLLHPRAGVPRRRRKSLVQARLRALPGDLTLPHRLRAGYPLFAIQWSLILLNEFLPRERQRRRLASPEAERDADRRPRQLRLSRNLLASLARDLEDSFLP
ncbi:MAG: hypothetical protein AAF725_26620, partial [Acidobacteriota bacterium]